jgi:hypothetical protein
MANDMVVDANFVPLFVDKFIYFKPPKEFSVFIQNDYNWFP